MKSMKYQITTHNPEHECSDCLIVSVFEDKQLSINAKILDKSSQGYLKKIIARGDINGDIGQTLLIQQAPGTKSARILLIGSGKKEDLNEHQFHKIIRAGINAIKDKGIKDAVFYQTELSVPKRNIAWKIRQATEIIANSLYRFDKLKSKKSDSKQNLAKISYFVNNTKDLAQGKQALSEAEAIVSGINFAKDLGNLPGNICTPTHLAQTAKELTKGNKKFKLTVLDEKTMQKHGMGALLAVSKGSDEPAKLIIMEYTGNTKTAKPYVLVGKGITFDSGGISLKPAAAMDEMKYDMGGAASVFGVMQAIKQLNLPINVVGIVASSENLPGGKATKPGDIVKTMSGQTVEILNTDAEGRLVLCDALTYAKKFKPQTIIDIATLTGAIVVGLGNFPSALYSNDTQLADALSQAADTSYDRIWPMPLWDDYQESLSSPFADIANISNTRYGGSITAACFLSRFTKDLTWAHLDVAGTAYQSGKNKGATGRPVPLLMQYLLDQVES